MSPNTLPGEPNRGFCFGLDNQKNVTTRKPAYDLNTTVFPHGCCAEYLSLRLKQNSTKILVFIAGRQLPGRAAHEQGTL